MVVAHELSHQWFGDLVTPAWWDDIWLNESFANWMGYRIGNEWRPDLKIGVGALDEAISEMDTDSQIAGRPIHQPITENSEIDSAFDSITYGKGGQVVAMIAGYLGDEKFKDGVRLHLSRHRYGNATSEEFFKAIADAARDPKVLAAFKSFVDQQGVPVVTFRRDGSKLVATQSRYAYLGSSPAPETWTIPLCVRAGASSQCTLMDQRTTTLTVPASGPVMPNVGGTGYYRFDLQPDDWQALIASSASLAPGEALAATDSLWASFRAGKAPAAWLVQEARAMAANPDSVASIDPGARFSGLRHRGMISDAAEPAYRSLIGSIYGPRLAAIGFDPAFAAHEKDDPDQQKLRQELVALMAFEAHDPSIRATLKSAAGKYLAGDQKALDRAFLTTGLTALAQDGGLPVAKSLVDGALATEDPDVRQAMLGAASSAGSREVATYLLDLNDKRLRSYDRLGLIYGLAETAETREFTADWILANYDQLLAGGNGIFITSRLPGALNYQCGVDTAARIERVLAPQIEKAEVGTLEFRRMIERVRDCGILKQAKLAEVDAALTSR
jgi:aminopeptidase N